MNLHGNNSDSFPEQSAAPGSNKTDDVYGELTPRHEAAAIIRSLADKAAEEYKKRGISPPPHVVSARSAGLRDEAQSRTADAVCAAVLNSSARKNPVAPPLCKLPVYVPHATLPYAMFLLAAVIFANAFVVFGQRREQAAHRDLQLKLQTVQVQNDKITKQLELLKSEAAHAKEIAQRLAHEDRLLNEKVGKLSRITQSRPVSITYVFDSAGVRDGTASQRNVSNSPTALAQALIKLRAAVQNKKPGLRASAFGFDPPRGREMLAGHTVEGTDQPVLLRQTFIVYDPVDDTAMQARDVTPSELRRCAVSGCGVNRKEEQCVARSHPR